MAGFTGYTAPTNASVPNFAVDVEDVYEHFDPLVGETVASAASLPASGNWVGRTVFVQAEDALYVCKALPSTWVAPNALEDDYEDDITLGPFWVATTNHWPRFHREGNRVTMSGALTRNSGASTGNMLTVPVGFRMAGSITVKFLGAAISSQAKAYELMYTKSTHQISNPSGYSDTSGTTGEVIPIHGTWRIDE